MLERVERISGVVTLVVGLVSLAVIAFGHGLIGDSLAWLTVGLPAVCLAVIGIGAIQKVSRVPNRWSVVRWLAIVGLALPTLLLLVVASYGVVMLPAFVVALWTAILSEVRSRRPAAPPSLETS